MKMKISLGNNMFIESDSMQFMIKKYTGAVDKEGKEIGTSLGYFSNLNAALKGLIKIRLLASTATSIKELQEDLNRIEKEIDELIKM